MSMADYVAQALLPCSAPGEEVSGALRLRVTRIGGQDLHLGMVGSMASVVLRGSWGTPWKSAISAQKRALAANGWIALWDKAEVTEFELEHESAYPLTLRSRRGMAELGSAILRRIALFHTICNAYSVSVWASHGDWVFGLQYDNKGNVDHRELLGYLMDDDLGLSLRVVREYCSCDASRPGGCHYVLASTALRGQLQLRFSGRFGASEGTREELALVGADRAWLDRVLSVNT